MSRWQSHPTCKTLLSQLYGSTSENVAKWCVKLKQGRRKKAKARLTLVLKERILTCSPFWIKQGSESSHSIGTVASLSAYTSRSKLHGSLSSGRKVTEAVICRMMACISEVISFADLSDLTSLITQTMESVLDICEDIDDCTGLLTRWACWRLSLCSRRRTPISPESLPILHLLLPIQASAHCHSLAMLFGLEYK